MTGGLNCCVVTEPIVFPAPVLKKLTHLQQNLLVHRRHFDMQKVDRLAERPGNLRRAVCRDRVRHCSPQVDIAVLEVDRHVRVRQLFPQLFPHCVQLRSARLHFQIEHQPVAALLPQDQARLSRRFPVDQHLSRVHGNRLGLVPVRDRNPLDVNRALHHQRLAHRHEQVARRRTLLRPRPRRHHHRDRDD
jgi:hypothetical protein